MNTRNFGTMSSEWQDRANKNKRQIGFHVTFQDGFEQDYFQGLVDIPDSDISEHGLVKSAIPIETKVS